MICPFCASKTKIYNSRSTHQKTQTWRRHRCDSCNGVFTTREKIDFDNLVQIKDPITGNSLPYSRERLLLSVIRASDKLQLPLGMITELVDSIETLLRHEQFFSTKNPMKQQISRATLVILTRYNKNFALQYLNQIHENQPPLEEVEKILKS